MKRHFFHFSLLCLLSFIVGISSANAQILTITPSFPTADDSVVIVYDATQGNAALAGFTGTVYAHTGLITNLSTSGTDWKRVQGTWGTADPKVQMTSLGNNKYQISFKIRTFYSVPQNETVLKLAFVFRNQAGTIVGRDVGGTDIFYDVASSSQLQASILSPALSGGIYSSGANITINAGSNVAANLSLYVNNTLVNSATNTTNISYNTTASTAGQYWVKVVADDGTNIVKDSIYYLVQGNLVVQNPPAGTVNGLNIVNNNTVIFALYAPYKNNAYLLLETNDYLPTQATSMKRSTDGTTWWVEVSGLNPNQEYGYQFLVNGSLKVADAYCEKTLDPWNDSYIPTSVYPNLKPYPVGKTTGVVSTFKINQPTYNWQITNFSRPKKTDLVVYELLLRDFTAEHSYQSLIDTLDYLKKLGVNTIELMPVIEFDGNISWGYMPNFLFAPDKYYGTKEKLKELIDVCHQNGIAVVLDIVLNHQAGLSPLVQLYWDATNNKPAGDNPWFNADATHPFNVGYDMNHDSPQTRAYVDRVIKHWVTEYKVDGYRFDLSKGFTQTNSGSNVGQWGQYDASRIYNLKRMYDQINAVDNSLYLILEHFADNSEEKELANYGFMFWGNMVNAYNENTMGWMSNSDFSWTSYKARGWNNPHLVSYMESHDEERLMYKNSQYGNVNGSYSTKNVNTALARMGEAAAFFFTVPGPKMIWQFGELGYDKSINLCPNGTINTTCRTDPKPILWNYFTVAERKNLYNIYRRLTYLKTQVPAMESSNFNLNVGNASAFKTIHVNDASMNIAVIGNFGMSALAGNPNFQNTGKWYDYLTGDSINVTNTTANITLQAGEYHVYTSQKVLAPANVSLEEEKVNGFEAIAFPNPSSEKVTFGFVLPNTTTAKLSVYNLMGQKVYQTELQSQAYEINEVEWDANVTGGTYFYLIEAANKTAKGKIILDK
ncbi:MAG: alpha-amylase family glycosyl hydrolase [Bacteroidia bacterium]